MEFVASETEQESQSDTCLSCFDEGESLLPFEAPADAMMQRSSGDMSAGGESLSEFPELAVSADSEERLGDSIPALVDPELVPRIGMGSSEGFSNDLLSLLEQLLGETLADDDEDLDGEDHPLLGIDHSRLN
jgi:hypothetical protein